MDIQSIISELKKERDRINQAIAALDGTYSRQKRTTKKTSRIATRRPRKRHLTAAGRKRLSMLMKQRWAERRRKVSKGRKPIAKAA